MSLNEEKKYSSLRSVFRVIARLFAVAVIALSVIFTGALALTFIFYSLDRGDIFAIISMAGLCLMIQLGIIIAVILAFKVLKRTRNSSGEGYDSDGIVKATVLLLISIALTVLANSAVNYAIDIKSPTFDPADYMSLDGWVEERIDKDHGELFPEEIPEDARDVKYYYTGSTGSKLADYFEIFAEWKSDSDYIETEIKRIKSLDGYCGEFTLGSYTCVSAGGGTPFHEETDFHNTVFFAYNLDTCTVRYVYLNAPYIETLSDADSYFYSLDW